MWRVRGSHRLIVFKFIWCLSCVCVLLQLRFLGSNVHYELIGSSSLRNSTSDKNFQDGYYNEELIESHTRIGSCPQPLQEVNIPSTCIANNQFSTKTYYDHFTNGSSEIWTKEKKLLRHILEKNTNLHCSKSTNSTITIPECGGCCVSGWGYVTGDSSGPMRPVYRPRPHLRARGFHCRPSRLSPSAITGVLRGGEVRGAYSWKSYFTINATANERFSTESALKWMKEAQLLKNMLEKDMDFNFTCPSGLETLLPGNGTYVIQESFRLSVNGKKQYPTDWEIDSYKQIYTFSDLKLKPGDIVEYSLKVSYQKHDVRGRLQVIRDRNMYTC